MFERDWVPSAAMARVLGIHPQTLRKLRRHQITPFKEGRDYRWVGFSTSSTLQWHVHSASKAFTDFRRMPACGAVLPGGAAEASGFLMPKEVVLF